MNEIKSIINKLDEKMSKDKKTLKIYNWVDNIFSILIMLLNIATIAIAITALVILVELRNNNIDIPKSSSEKISDKFISSAFDLVVALTVFILLSFCLNISLAIWKANSKQNLYKKISNTLNYIQYKYEAGLISDEQLEQLLEVIANKSKIKSKIVILDIVKNELSKKGK
ncbi:hypothetical protein H9M94_01410 [Mycoplasma sp. Pen4]|uniref:hypothetical protein n=1 Tax=Mycoplasma sp. Pen4 TaxID=640330 RepID=UPI0016544C60|nr:hypothetical protein [Mycoplasma sp. Pen4]QNM93913.1 hypothetical protein H9M94_01410 [Mycoplasma sp. Pen4]